MATTTIIAGITKTVKYNRLNKDFDCFVTIDGGEPLHIGYAQTAHEGEEKCNAYAYDYLSDNNAPEAAAELVMQDEPTPAHLGQRLCAARAVVMDADTRTEAERRYDAERDGSLYFAPVVDETPVTSLDTILARIQALTPATRAADRATLAHAASLVLMPTDGRDAPFTATEEAIITWLAGDGDPEQWPVGSICGLPVYPVCSGDEDRHIYELMVTWQGMRVASDGNSYIDLPSTGDFVGDFSAAEWERVKALAHTTITEELYAFASAFLVAENMPLPVVPEPPKPAPAPKTYVFDPTNINHRAGYAAAELTYVLRELTPARADGVLAFIHRLDSVPAVERDQLIDRLMAMIDAPPPPAAPASAVQAECFYPDPKDSDGYTSEPNGSLVFVDFTYGKAQLSVNADGGIGHMTLGRASTCQIKALQALPDLEVILADPRVQAMRRGHTPPVVTVEADADGSVTYRCGENAVYFDPTFPEVQMAVMSCAPFEYEQVATGLPDLVALMADPRVQSARVRFEAGAPLKKAA